MIQNNELNNKDHLAALWQWRYNLLDVIPFCEALLDKNNLEDHELNLLTMMALSHWGQKRIVEKITKALKERFGDKNVNVKDAKRMAYLCVVLKS